MERRKQLTVAWVPTFSENYIPQHVFVGGHDSTSHEQLFIGRAMHNKWLIPGKIPRGSTTLLIPYFGEEIPVDEFEILVAEEKHALQWVPQRDGAYPENAVKGGFEDDVILYVARAKDPDGGACIGKLHPRHKVCYFPWKGKENHSYEYEVLCCI